VKNPGELVALGTFGDDIEVFLHLGGVLGGEHVVQSLHGFALEKLLRGTLPNGHVDQQHVALAGFRETLGQTRRDGGDTGVVAETREGDQLGFVRQVLVLKVADQPIAEGFVEGRQDVRVIPTN
jgi:hypothetical protein